MANRNLPTLYVEGYDDVSVINGLLKRHGIDTKSGEQHLFIHASLSVNTVLDNIASAVKASNGRDVGFVIDIDVEIDDRWRAVCERLRQAGDSPPASCPLGGYINKIPEYQSKFGVWLMPDCKSDSQKMEHLAASLIPAGDPLWPFAKQCAAEAKNRVDSLNKVTPNSYERFKDADLIKSEIHTWLSWQKEPGVALGAAVNSHILGCDSPQALAVLDWLKRLYGFKA